MLSNYPPIKVAIKHHLILERKKKSHKDTLQKLIFEIEDFELGFF